MANPLIIGGVLVATGTGAVGIYVSGNSTIAHVDSITATTSISVVGGATASVAGNQFDPVAVAGTGAIEYQYGDRAVWDALNYQARHANDLDNVAGIHHTLGDGAGQAAPGNHTHVPGDIDLTDTHILVGNGSNVAADVAMSGDATIANSGALTLATVNANVGAFTNASITVNAKGLITAAASGSASHTIQDEGISLTTRANLNFVGSGVIVTDDAGNNASVVTIEGTVQVYNETQEADGTSTTYYLINTANPGTIRVYVNGIRQTATDDTAPTDIVNFVSAPIAGAVLMFDYEMELV